MGKPRLSSETSAKVQIRIINVNDCPPIFSQSEYNVSLLLPTYQNVVVLQVNATDRDDSDGNYTLLYEINEDTNKNGVFQVDSRSGIITTR